MSISEKFLTYDLQTLEKLGGAHTAREIALQPILWEAIWDEVYEQKNELSEFTDKAIAHEATQVILTGAGSSAFVGQVVEDSLRKSTRREVRAVPTTDIVTHYEQKIDPDRPLFLISFARSGNSPESTAAVNLAEEYCNTVFHLIITCNENGNLTKAVRDCSQNRSYIFTLPPQAEDKGLAMTGSFTGMVLAAVLIARIKVLEEMKPYLNSLIEFGRNIINEQAKSLLEAADKKFSRIVFLGSGCHLGIANESHLKVQELTDGKVIGKFDSFLGFRHGPRAVLDQNTLLVYLFSHNSYVHKYEMDLARAINENQDDVFTIGIATNNENASCNLSISLGFIEEHFPEEFLAIASVIPAQIIGFAKSIQLGLKPDTPSVNGSISRVVQGVKIHPVLK